MYYRLYLTVLLLCSSSPLASSKQPKQTQAAFGIPFMNQNDVGSAAAAATLWMASSLVGLPSTASATTTGGDIGKGEQLFVNNCAGCHMGGNNFANEKRTLKKEALLQYGVGLDQPSLERFVTNSLVHQKLVFFRVEGGKLTPDQWEDVTTYIADQANGDKW
jgi:cytochrome c6